MTNSLSLFFVKHVMLVGELYPVRTWRRTSSAKMAAIPLWFKLSRRIRQAQGHDVGDRLVRALVVPSFPLVMVAPSEWFTHIRRQRGSYLFRRPPVRRPSAGPEYLEGVEAGKLPVYLVVMCLKGSAIGRLVGAAVRDVR